MLLLNLPLSESLRTVITINYRPEDQQDATIDIGNAIEDSEPTYRPRKSVYAKYKTRDT